MSIPEWIYLAMGAVIARILLNGTSTQGYTPMDWARLVFHISRIVILWPLVLFVEKIEDWLASGTKESALPVKNGEPVIAAEAIDNQPIHEVGGSK